MDCDTIHPLLTRYADDELDERERRLVDEHLHTCVSCRAEAETLKAENEAYAAALPAVPAPEGFQEAVMDRIRGGEGEPFWQRLRLPSLVATLRVSPALAAAAALLLLVVFGLPSMLTKSAAVKVMRGPTLGAGASKAGPVQYERAGGLQEEAVRPGGAAAGPTAGDHTAPMSAEDMRRELDALRTRSATSGGGVREASASVYETFTQLAPYGNASDAGAPLLSEVDRLRSRVGEAKKEWVSSQNLGMSAPRAVTETEVLDNTVAARRVALAGTRGDVYDWVPRGATPGTTATPPPVAGYSLLQGGQRPITPESTKATVTLAVYYKELPGEPAEDRSWATTYQAQFDGAYTVRAPESKRKGVRIELTFPFPPSASTIQDAKLTVDGAEDARKTTYSLAGIRWAGWFEPEQERTLSVAYRAYGKGDYVYALPKDSICKALDLEIRVHNLRRGVRPELAPESLPATIAPLERGDANDFRWTYNNTITRRDIVLQLPEKTAVTPMLERVAQYTDEILPLCRFAPLLLALFLGGLLATVRPGGSPLRMDAVMLLAIAFLAFFPLYMFTAAYLGPAKAFGLSLALILVVTIAYAALAGGQRVAGVVAFFGAVCLGGFGYALLKPELRGIIFTAGGLLVLLWFMVLSARRPRAPTAPPPDNGS